MRKWDFYTAKEIKPSGWLKRQLRLQAEGLSGNLDKVWRDVRDSRWIGGDAEGWERVPYWLDGFIPLAYLLSDEDMISRAKKYIDAILSFQRADGWICPCDDKDIPTYDTWAVQLISKVLVVYYECSADERIPDAVYRVMKNYYTLLKSGMVKLFDWGKYRWYETFIAINFLKERYTDAWLDELAEILYAEGKDYTTLLDKWKKPFNKWTLDTHIVNIVMALKAEAVCCDALGKEYSGEADRLYEVLSRYNGTAVGLFTGDECLSGLSPIQGTELCSVVEQMYSYEQIFAYTGEGKWAERLEMLAFNALVAGISDDMWTHQYDQMSNQIACRRLPGKSIFRTNSGEAHLFGLEPHFGCCTANFSQGWPKLALSAFMHRGDRVLSAIPIPSVLDADGIRITLDTEYPFKNGFVYNARADRDISLTVRIPSFARDFTVNGVPTVKSEEITFNILKDTDTRVEISYDIEPLLVDRPHDLKCVRCGSLVFSLPIEYEAVSYEYEKDGVLRKAPYCDYEYIPKSDFGYAYSSPFFKVERGDVSDIPFCSKNPPVTVLCEVRKIFWGFEEGYDSICAKVPASREPISEAMTVRLYPYGSAKLRMTELPLV
ncbi:MAG: glycoside hydrolase family 127 protein [Clostridia bacterium]|nr:glycoside hydrolase family 127 protein [Clostridia bacterium]